jgi:hypothetical protein
MNILIGSMCEACKARANPIIDQVDWCNKILRNEVDWSDAEKKKQAVTLLEVRLRKSEGYAQVCPLCACKEGFRLLSEAICADCVVGKLGL